MNLADISAKISSLTTTDTVQYPNADRLIDINLWQQKIVGMIMKAEDETYFDDARFTGYPKVTIALTTNRDYYISPSQTDTGGIAYSVLKMKSLSVSYNGVDYYKANPVDLAETNLPDAPASATTANSKLDKFFSKTAPKYSYKNGALLLYPMPDATDVANGGKMIVELERGAADFTLSDLTTGTAIPGFDVTFHAMLAYGPASEFCLSKGMPQYQGVYRELQVYEQRLADQYSSKQLDRRYQFSADYQSMK
jgi:hypothetical protein